VYPLGDEGGESMRVRKGFVLASLAVSASLTGCNPAPKPLTVACTTEKDQIDVVRLDLRQGQATLLSVSPALTGKAAASPTEYEATFQPGPDGASRLVIKINRYTLRGTRELGTPAGAAAPAEGSRSTGICERFTAKPL
jgi:hypothetical protein